jgi:hypothetical protein
MIDKEHLESMAEEIQTMRNIAEHLKDMGKGIGSVECNIERILSSIRLLELNISDVVKIY